MDGHEEWRIAAVKDGELVATASVMNTNCSVVTIYQLYVKPEWRGKGIGSGIVEAVEQLSEGKVSAVVEDGGPLGFWKSLGYNPVHFENGRKVVSK